MGDFRKHIRQESFPENIEAGIRHHLEVDRFTDTHILIKDLKKYFSPERRRFAGIITDVVFDHYLIRHWSRFSEIELDEFIGRVHRDIRSLWHFMPERMQKVMDYMIREDWLTSYTDLSGIEAALDRMSLRIRFENKLYGSIEEVVENYETMENVFLEFFPELVSATNKN